MAAQWLNRLRRPQKKTYIWQCNGRLLPEGAGGKTERIEVEDDKLYRIVADLYSGQMLSAVTDMSHGLLSVVPKHADVCLPSGPFRQQSSIIPFC